jgi:hypothetical protein
MATLKEAYYTQETYRLLQKAKRAREEAHQADERAETPPFSQFAAVVNQGMENPMTLTPPKPSRLNGASAPIVAADSVSYATTNAGSARSAAYAARQSEAAARTAAAIAKIEADQLEANLLTQSTPDTRVARKAAQRAAQLAQQATQFAEEATQAGARATLAADTAYGRLYPRFTTVINNARQGEEVSQEDAEEIRQAGIEEFAADAEESCQTALEASMAAHAAADQALVNPIYARARAAKRAELVAAMNAVPVETTIPIVLLELIEDYT